MTEHRLSMIAALRIISRTACESFTTGPGSCFRNGRTPSAEFGADQCCPACIAWAALPEITDVPDSEAAA